MKKNIYEIIQESITTSVTTSVTSSVIRSMLPDNAWLLLAQFGSYKLGEDSRSFSTTELKRIIRDNMHMNTLRRMLSRLESKALIRLYNKNSGKTKTGYRYVITTDGMLLWEKYLQEMKNNIGKVQI